MKSIANFAIIALYSSLINPSLAAKNCPCAAPAPVAPASGASSFGTCDQVCQPPDYLYPVTQYGVAIAASPLYVSILPLTPQTQDIDNVCYTFFPLGGPTGTALLIYFSITYSNGTNVQYSYVKDDVPGLTGSLTGGNPTCLFQEFIFSMQCNETFIINRCFISGTCDEFEAAKNPGYDVIFGVSALPYQDDCCKYEQIQYVKSLSYYRTQGFIALPQKLPYNCVACLPNYGNAINAGNLPEQFKTCVKTNLTTDCSCPCS